MLTALLFIASTHASADSLRINGMSCHGCEKQIRSVVCFDKQVQSWVQSCDAKVIDPEKELGELRYVLRDGVTLDPQKLAHIQELVTSTGRTLNP